MSRVWSFLGGAVAGVWAAQNYDLPRLEVFLDMVRDWEQRRRKK